MASPALVCVSLKKKFSKGAQMRLPELMSNSIFVGITCFRTKIICKLEVCTEHRLLQPRQRQSLCSKTSGGNQLPFIN